MRAVILTIAAGAGACITGGGSRPEVAFENTGRVCLYPTENGGRVFFADMRVHLSFALEDVCLSSSCTTERMGSCEVAAVGGIQHVTTSASWVDLTRTGMACTDDCGQPGALCQTEPLPAGDHTFVFGDAPAVTLTIPGEVAETPCLHVPTNDNRR